MSSRVKSPSGELKFSQTLLDPSTKVDKRLEVLINRRCLTSMFGLAYLLGEIPRNSAAAEGLPVDMPEIFYEAQVDRLALAANALGTLKDQGVLNRLKFWRPRRTDNELHVTEAVAGWHRVSAVIPGMQDYQRQVIPSGQEAQAAIAQRVQTKLESHPLQNYVNGDIEERSRLIASGEIRLSDYDHAAEMSMNGLVVLLQEQWQPGVVVEQPRLAASN